MTIGIPRRAPVGISPPPSGLKSGIYSLVGLAAPLLVYLLATPFLIARLGLAQYGILTLLLTITALLGSMDFGLSAGGVRGVGQALATGDQKTAILIVRETVTLFFLLGAIAAGVVILAAPSIADALGMTDAAGSHDAILLVRIAGFSLLFIFTGAGLSLLPRALERFPTVTLIQVASSIAMWGGAVLLIVSGSGLLQIIWWTAILTATVCLVYAGWNARLLPDMVWRPTPRFTESKRIFSYSAYAFAAQVTSMITYHADKLLIAYFLGPAPVAYYAVAVNLASKLLSIAAALTSFVFPRAITLTAAGERASVANLYLRASRFTLLAIFPLAMPVFWLAPQFLSLWLGSEFAANAAVLLQVLTAAYCIALMSVAASQVYNGLGNSRIGAAYAAAGSLINLALCVLLIPLFGTVGATLGVLAGMMQAIIYAGSLEHHLGMGWFGGQRKLYAQLALTLVLQSLQLYAARGLIDGWVALIAIGGSAWLAFYAIWIVCGFMNDDDKILVRRLKNRWAT